MQNESDLLYDIIGIKDVENTNPAILHERLKELLVQVRPKFFAPLQQLSSSSPLKSKYSWISTYNNLQRLYKLCLGYYTEHIGSINGSGFALPDITAIAKDSDRNEEKKLIMLVLGIVSVLENESSLLLNRDDNKDYKRSIFEEIKAMSAEIKEREKTPSRFQPPVLLEYQTPSASPVSDRLWQLQGRKDTFSSLAKENTLLKEELKRMQQVEKEMVQLRTVVLQLSKENSDLHEEREHLLKKLEDTSFAADVSNAKNIHTASVTKPTDADALMKLQQELDGLKDSYQREIRLLMSAWYELGLHAKSTPSKSKKSSWLARQRDLLAAHSYQLLHQFTDTI